MSMIWSLNPTGGVRPGGLFYAPPSAPAGPSPIPAEPRQRVLFARDLSIGLFVECAWLADFAGLAVKRHRTVRDALVLLGPAGATGMNPMNELGLFASTTQPVRDAIGWAADTVERLIEPLADTYNGYSAGALTIGPLTAPNAHAAAVVLARRFTKLYDRHANELHPVAGWNPHDYPPPTYCPPTTKDVHPKHVIYRVPMPFPAYSILPAEQSRLTRLWHRKARRFRGRLLDVVGGDYDRDHRKWVALVKVEAGRVLAGLPADPSPRTYLEKEVIATLTAKGQRLTGEKLLHSMKLNPENGSLRQTLANMRERGQIDNKSGKGGGYGLPGWK
jgi:hypothetical protein